MALPDFFIAGAPKAGTTALHAALARHPALYMSPVKEPKFFMTNGPPPNQGGPGDIKTYREHIWRQSEYEKLFEASPGGQLRGESTPFYLYNHAAQLRIRKLVPAAKLIVILRDPVERAHSNWTHLWSAGLDPIDDFIRACEAEDRRIAEGWADFWHYLHLGMYGRQLEHLYSVFPPEQVLIFRYRALVTDPTAVLDGVCRFLGVPDGRLAEIPRENVTAHPRSTARHRSVARLMRAGSNLASVLPGQVGSSVTDALQRRLQADGQPRQPLTWEQRRLLLPRFEADIRLLESLTGEEFSDWLEPRGESGGLVGARPRGQQQARNGRPRDF